MKIRQNDNSQTSFWVSSESDGDREYLVEAACLPLGHNEHGHMTFNGCCMATKGTEEWVEHGCKDYIYRCEPKLRKPENMGKAYRCKHIIAVRNHLSDYSLDGFIAGLALLNPNLHDDQLP